MAVKLDISNIFRLEYLSPTYAKDLYSKTADLLVARLSDVAEKVVELKDERKRHLFVDKTLSVSLEGELIGGLNYDFEIYYPGSGFKNALHVKYIAVKDNFQGAGIGSLLLVQAEKIAKESNIESITLKTVCPLFGEFDLPSWYQKRGFKELQNYHNPRIKRNFLKMEKSI